MIAVLAISVLSQVFLQLYSICNSRFSGFAMNLIWGMMNDLSFIVSLGMISIPIPGIASPIQSLLSSIIYLDLLLTDKWLSTFLEEIDHSSDEDEDMPLNLFIGSQGFQSRLLLFNLGSTLVFTVIQVLLLLYTGLIKLLSSVCLRAKKQYAFLEHRFIWGGTFRFIIQQFQPLIFSSLINIRSVSLSDLQASSLGISINFYLSVVIFAAMMITIIVLFYIVRKGKAGEKRFSTLIEGLNSTNSNLAQYWTVWTLVKWSLMCFVLILLSDYPCQQIQLLNFLSLLSTAFQLAAKPMKSKNENVISTLLLVLLMQVTISL
ncbi:hypothetical protein FGO68_gene1035 [Halteria grandinella]|uniref:Uncharacterized protein n=1 Tax=Halteria grandinella TaxID=5974 RepID=A0A8J8P6X2_HALGN|nr:hypothetical protein FGO68_gene1035 [Halteria grandinella]